MSLVYLEWLE